MDEARVAARLETLVVATLLGLLVAILAMVPLLPAANIPILLPIHRMAMVPLVVTQA
jgi:hypothetical protein